MASTFLSRRIALIRGKRRASPRFATSAAFFCPRKISGSDPWDRRPFAFVSHAHSDHIAAHEEIIVSERSARLDHEIRYARKGASETINQLASGTERAAD